MEQTSRKSKALSIALAMVMAISLNIPLIAWADEGGESSDAAPVAAGVAEVNGVTYATLQEAVAAVTDGSTLVLLQDVSVTLNDTNSNSGADTSLWIEANDVVLDLGGHNSPRRALTEAPTTC